MKRLYFVRHARTVENEQGRMIGTRDGTLSLEGQRQADRLVQALLQEPIDLIISSTLRRAQETARILNADATDAGDPVCGADTLFTGGSGIAGDHRRGRGNDREYLHG